MACGAGMAGADGAMVVMWELISDGLWGSQMDWFNSAGMMISGWKTPFPVPSLPPGQKALDASGISSSWGFRIAQKLLQEVSAAHARRMARGAGPDAQVA
jgi:hypothetical protein